MKYKKRVPSFLRIFLIQFAAFTTGLSLLLIELSVLKGEYVATHPQHEAVAEYLWLLMIPLVLGVVLLEVFLIIRRLRHTMKPIEKAMRQFSSGEEPELELSELPEEFQTIGATFLDMRQQILKHENDKQRIVANLSHDLKTPLTVISGYAEALNEDILPEDMRKKATGIIQEKVRDLTSLTDMLVTYTKLDHPDFKLYTETRDLCEYLRQYISQRYQEMEDQGHEVKIHIPQESLPVSMDPAMLKRVFDNLVGNSLSHNQGPLKLWLTVTPLEDCISISYADNGGGIDSAIREYIFEPFVTDNKARTSGTGNGLGLSIARTIMKLHGGDICLSEEAHMGTTEFILTLPKAEEV